MNSLFVSGGVNTAMAYYFFESQKSKVNTVYNARNSIITTTLVSSSRSLEILDVSRLLTLNTNELGCWFCTLFCIKF